MAECGRTGQHLNAKKIEYIIYNISSQGPLLASNSTIRDYKERKASAWRALINLEKTWSSNLPSGLKSQIFAAAIKTLYNCKAWTLTAALTKSLDDCNA